MMADYEPAQIVNRPMNRVLNDREREAQREATCVCHSALPATLQSGSESENEPAVYMVGYPIPIP
jgi:hypothetical protein